MRAKRLVAWILLGALVGSGCGAGPPPTEIAVGTSRERILAEFGEPRDRQVMVKSDPHVFGPIETFWSSLPDGARVEIWSYTAPDGTVELYFVDDSATVRGTGFAPDGVVF